MPTLNIFRMKCVFKIDRCRNTHTASAVCTPNALYLHTQTHTVRIECWAIRLHTPVAYAHRVHVRNPKKGWTEKLTLIIGDARRFTDALCDGDRICLLFCTKLKNRGKNECAQFGWRDKENKWKSNDLEIERSKKVRSTGLAAPTICRHRNGKFIVENFGWAYVTCGPRNGFRPTTEEIVWSLSQGDFNLSLVALRNRNRWENWTTDDVKKSETILRLIKLQR